MNNLKETTLQEIAIQALTKDFLDANDAAVDYRSYLVETTLTTVVLAIEQLLKEVEAKKIVIDTSGEKIVRFKQQNNTPFDPLNWLGQYLYRNNPRYSNFSDANASPYQKGMHEVSLELKTRLFNIETNKRTKKREVEIEKKHFEAREKMAKAVQDFERQKSFEELLPAIFTKWTVKLFRQQGSLTRDEIKLATRSIAEDPIVLACVALAEKFVLIDSLIWGSGNNETAIVDTSTEFDDGASEQDEIVFKVPNSVFAGTWSLKIFVDNFMALTESWSIDDLQEYLSFLYSYIDEIGKALIQKVTAMLFSPIFTDDNDNLSKKNWSNKLVKIVVDLHSLDSQAKEKIKRSVIENLVAIETDGVPTEIEFSKFSFQIAGEYGLEPTIMLLEEIKKHCRSRSPNGVSPNAVVVGEAVIEKISKENNISNNPILDTTIPLTETTVVELNHTNGSSTDRSIIEKNAIDKIHDLSLKHNVPVAEICQLSLEIVNDAYSKIYPSQEFSGVVLLAESVVVDVNMSETGNSESVMGKLLKYVAWTNNSIKESSGENKDLERDIFENKLVKRSVCGNDDGALNSILSYIPEKDVSAGVIDIFGFDKNIADEDLAFLEACAASLGHAFVKITRLNNLVSLAISSKEWAEEKGHPVKIYLVESDEVDRFYAVEPKEREKDSSKEFYFKLPKGEVLLVNDENRIKDLSSCLLANSSVQVAGKDGAIEVLQPFFENEKCFAIIATDGSGSLELPEAAEHSVFSILVNVFKQSAIYLCCNDDSDLLEAEKIDNETRRNLIFSKLMLLAARKSLAKIDSKSLSELKSYKSPPVVIHKVINATLLLFGKLPSEIKKWSDTVKFINADLLTEMILYDPTSIQKKVRVRRMKFFLKGIKYGDALKKGSSPCQDMHEWQLISLELRDRAVESRKIRSDMYSNTEDDDVDDKKSEDGYSSVDELAVSSDIADDI